MKKTNRNSKTKYLIIVNLLLILSLMTASVYAWFSVNVDNNVNAYEIEVESDNSLELSFTTGDNAAWANSLNLNNLTDSNNQKVMETMKFVEITGDGTSFLIPQLEQKGNYVNLDKTKEWTPAQMNKDYLQFTVYMRSKEALSVYLSSDSAANPCSSTYVGADSGNKSGNGDFSKDCVVGALRVAYQGTGLSKYVWIPKPEFHLDNLKGSETYNMVTNATSTSYSDGTGAVNEAYEWNNPYEHYYYNSSKTFSKASETGLNLVTSLPKTETPDNAGSSLLATLTKANANDEYYTGSATFTVWVEGCDTEARRALVGGKLNLSLVLDSFTTEAVN